MTDRYTYDAYGAILSHDRYANTIDQPYQYVGRLGYYTHTWVPEFGLLQLGVRFYDPETGRFERRDLLGPPDESLYGYVGGNPVSGLDPTGYYRRDDKKKCEERAKAVAQALYELMKDVQGARDALKRGQCVDPGKHGRELKDRISHLTSTLDDWNRNCKGRKGIPPCQGLRKTINELWSKPKTCACA